MQENRLQRGTVDGFAGKMQLVSFLYGAADAIEV